MPYFVSDMAYMLLTLKDSQNTVSSGNAVNNFARFVSLLIVFILVLAVTYYTTRFVAKSQKGMAGSGNMELIESLPLGNNKYLQLVRVGDKYLLLGCGKDSMSLVAELGADEVKRTGEGNTASGFSEILKRLKERNAGEGVNDEDKA